MALRKNTSWPLWYKRWMFSCTLSFSEWPQLKPGIASKIDQHFLWKYYTFVKRQVLQNLEEFSLRGEEGIYGGCKFLEFLVDSIPGTRIWKCVLLLILIFSLDSDCAQIQYLFLLFKVSNFFIYPVTITKTIWKPASSSLPSARQAGKHMGPNTLVVIVRICGIMPGFPSTYKAELSEMSRLQWKCLVTRVAFIPTP